MQISLIKLIIRKRKGFATKFLGVFLLWNLGCLGVKSAEQRRRENIAGLVNFRLVYGENLEDNNYMERPRAYLESSLAIEYFGAEGSEYSETETDAIIHQPQSEGEKYLGDLLNSNKYYSLAKSMRRSIFDDTAKVIFVVSPLVWIEMNSWIAEENFKSEASRVTWSTQVQRIGWKQLGEYLTDTLKKSLESPPHTGAKDLFSRTTVSQYHLLNNGLNGVEKCELSGFSIGPKNEDIVLALSYVQMGLADILHLLVAQHLGCHYFATLDGDYARNRELVSRKLGLEVLFKEEVRKVL
jgi:hypothetical protein